MDCDAIARQTQIEHDLLRHVMEGLRVTSAWQVPGPDGARKLSTLRFIAGSFQRHLERLLGLEEHDGYMGVVSAPTAHLGRLAATLRAEHDGFRVESRRIVVVLERLPAEDVPGLDSACAELLRLLDRVEGHNRKEMALLHEAVARDEGGEG
jgi:hypothetical protein